MMGSNMVIRIRNQIKNKGIVVIVKIIKVLIS